MAYAPIVSITFTRDSSQDIGASQTYTYTYPKDSVVYIQIKKSGYDNLYKRVWLTENKTINADIVNGIIEEEPTIKTRRLTFSVGVPNASPINVSVNDKTYTNNYNYETRTIDMPVGESVSISITGATNTSVYNSSNTTYIPNNTLVGSYSTTFTMPDEDLSFMYDSWDGPI